MTEIGLDWGKVAVVYGTLFVGGYAYNALVAWLERMGYDEGYTALLVVAGTLFTLIGVAVIYWQGALLTLGAFAASGFWMVVGSWWRHVRARRRAQDAVRQAR